MTGAERAEVMVRMTFGPNHGIEFSPDGALLAVCSAHHVEIIDVRGGRVLGDCLWWAAGLSRLGPAEVSSRFPEVRRLPPGAPILPA